MIDRSAELVGEFVRPVHSLQVDGSVRRSLRLSKHGHGIDVDRVSRGKQTVGSGRRRHGKDGLDSLGLIFSIIVTTHGSKVAKDFSLDTANLFHLVIPSVLRTFSSTNATGFSPLIDLVEELITLLAKLLQ